MAPIHHVTRLARVAFTLALLCAFVPQAAWAGEPQATSLTLSWIPATSFAYASVSGSLLGPEGLDLTGSQVVLQSSTNTVDWSPAGTLTAGPGGAFSTNPSIGRTTYFRASFAGTPEALPSASAVATAPFLPLATWVTEVPWNVASGQKFPVSVTVPVPGHEGVECTATFEFSRYTHEGTFIESKIVPVRGSFDATAGVVTFATTTSLRHAGDHWGAVFRLAADAAHDEVVRWGVDYFSVGVTRTLSLSGKSSVAAGGSVALTGYLRNVVDGHGITGQYVRLEGHTAGHSWSKVASVKSGSSGKVAFVAHPSKPTRYRLVYPGSSTWVENKGPEKAVATYLTFTGTASGDFTSKKYWLAGGSHRFTVTDGFRRDFSIHSQDEVFKRKLEYMVYPPGNTYVDVPKTGYYHFKAGKAKASRYTIRIWN